MSIKIKGFSKAQNNNPLKKRSMGLSIWRALIVCIALMGYCSAECCTSALVGKSRTKNGNMLLWKHRDTSAEDNFLYRVEPKEPGKIGYVGLFNGGDSLLREAWMGANDKGFCIINTASYNLAPDTAKLKDQEGIVMAKALESCVTLNDFKNLLDTLPKPMGVQANFGVMDAEGNGGYFETDDYHYTFFDLKNSTHDILVRTNHSLSGDPENGGMGYIRFINAEYLLEPYIRDRNVSPIVFTEVLSCSLYHALTGYANGNTGFVVDQDYIPRRISTSSIVIEMTKDGPVFWTVLGYPPASHVVRATLTDIPDELLPTLPGWHSPRCMESLRLKKEIFPVRKGNGQYYINLESYRRINDKEKEISRKLYKKYGYTLDTY